MHVIHAFMPGYLQTGLGNETSEDVDDLPATSNFPYWVKLFTPSLWYTHMSWHGPSYDLDTETETEKERESARKWKNKLTSKATLTDYRVLGEEG